MYFVLIYQETRRILIAVWQYIIYNEFVMLVVGPDRAAMYDLLIEDEDDYTGKRPCIREYNKHPCPFEVCIIPNVVIVKVQEP